MADPPRRDDPAVSMFFKVIIDGHDLGSFSKCTGLSFEVEILPVTEGGNNDFVHKLPGGISYGNVTFSRAINADSGKLASWFASMNGQITRTTATIVALTTHDTNKEIARWTLRDVIPVKWSGPEFNAGSGNVATETFEIAHHGFLGA